VILDVMCISVGHDLETLLHADIDDFLIRRGHCVRIYVYVYTYGDWLMRNKNKQDNAYRILCFSAVGDDRKLLAAISSSPSFRSLALFPSSNRLTKRLHC
jgi:hypothetical protein